MLQARIAGLAICLALVGYAGHASSTTPSATIRIVEQRWTGTSRAQPTPTSADHKAVAGKSIALVSNGERPRLTIGDITGGVLGFSVSNVAPVNPSGGIKLSACGLHRFRLKIGGKVKFATCSLDQGATWTVSRPS